MRIVAGSLGGRRIVAPGGDQSRPTSARVREAIFSMIGPDLIGATVLDLFAGSGALGFEALSRGAVEVDFVDAHPAALAAVRRNADAFAVADRIRARRLSWDAALASDRRECRLYGLVLLDPPYSLIPEIRADIADALIPVLAPDAVVVAEGPRDDPCWPGLEWPCRDRRHGGTVVSVYRKGDRT